MKNLILGASKLDWFTVEPFIISFKQNFSDADLVLFVDDVSDFTMQKLKNGGGNIIILSIPDDLKSVSVIVSRWEMFKRFLDEHAEYDKILVTDVRDVFFQGDVFESYAGYENFLVYADEGYANKDDPAHNNQNWLIRLFGENAYQKIADKPAICCGTVFGSREEMKIFLAGMMKILKRDMQWGDDQAAMNYLVHNKLLPIKNIFASSFMSGGISTTVYCVDFSNFIRGDKILSGDGKIPAVVHQYDRHQKMIQLVDRLCREKYFQLDGRFLDARSSFEQTLCLAFRQNWIDATKIFVSNVFYAGLNNSGDSYLKIWQMILQAPPANSDAEILSVAVQAKIPAAFSANVNINQMEKICAAYDFSAKNHRAIHPALKNFVANMAVRFAEIFNRNGRIDLSLKYLERAARLVNAT